MFAWFLSLLRPAQKTFPSILPFIPPMLVSLQSFACFRFRFECFPFAISLYPMGALLKLDASSLSFCVSASLLLFLYSHFTFSSVYCSFFFSFAVCVCVQLDSHLLANHSNSFNELMGFHNSLYMYTSPFVVWKMENETACNRIFVYLMCMRWLHFKISTKRKKNQARFPRKI